MALISIFSFEFLFLHKKEVVQENLKSIFKKKETNCACENYSVRYQVKCVSI